MKRSVAALALLVTVWSQLASLGCEMASGGHARGEHGPASRASETAVGHAEHAVPSADAPSPARHATAEDRGDGPESSDCGLLMTCGASAVEGVSAVATLLVAPDRVDPRAAGLSPPSGLDRAFDPPPPRALS